MEIHKFKPENAYAFLNACMEIVENYPVRFQDKQVTEVHVLVEAGMPISAMFHYKTDEGAVGVVTDNLRGRILDQPRSSLDHLFVGNRVMF